MPVVNEISVDTIWFPPNCFDESAIEKAEQLKLNCVSNVCPIGILRRINKTDQKNSQILLLFSQILPKRGKVLIFIAENLLE